MTGGDADRATSPHDGPVKPGHDGKGMDAVLHSACISSANRHAPTAGWPASDLHPAVTRGRPGAAAGAHHAGI
jgi:hypothetical protein